MDVNDAIGLEGDVGKIGGILLFLTLSQIAGARSSCSDVMGRLLSNVESAKLRALPNRTYARTHPEKFFVDVSKVQGLEHAYIAIFNNRVFMNEALGRLTIFQTQGRIISSRNLIRKNSIVSDFSGHDLPARVIQKFREADLKSQKRLNEEKFWNGVILPLVEKDPNMTLIAASVDTSLEKNVSHELLHAYFYEKPDLRAKILVFWSERVTATDKERFLSVLKREKYDVKDQEQVINEFFAYTLESGKPIIFPSRLINRYQNVLKLYLRDSGIDLPF